MTRFSSGNLSFFKFIVFVVYGIFFLSSSLFAFPDSEDESSPNPGSLTPTKTLTKNKNSLTQREARVRRHSWSSPKSFEEIRRLVELVDAEPLVDEIGVRWKDLRELAKSYEDILRENHQFSSRTYARAGFVFFSQNQMKKAMKYYGKAFKDPEFKDAYDYACAGVACSLTEQYKKAARYYKKALEINPNLPSCVYADAAISHFFIGSNKDAEDYANQAFGRINTDSDPRVLSPFHYLLSLCDSETLSEPVGVELYEKWQKTLSLLEEETLGEVESH